MTLLQILFTQYANYMKFRNEY